MAMAACATKPGGTGAGDLGAVRESSGVEQESPSFKLELREAIPERPASRDSSSPDNTCAICLGKPENKSFTDSCFHTFCFGCLAEWAKLKPECPLCKQRFKSIIHSVRSLEDYDQYFLSEQQYHTSNSYPTSFSADGPDGRRFRFPTTLTAERRQQLALERSMQDLGQRVASGSLRPRSGPRPSEAVGRYGVLTTTSAQRQQLYDLDFWVSNDSTRYREASPQFYRDNPACVHRLIPWLNREIIALLGGSSSRITAVLELVLSLISEVDIRHPDFERHLYPSFGSRTRHFVHEFYSFATSVHDMVNYDRNAIYESAGRVLARGTPVRRYQAYLESQRRAAEFISSTRCRESSPQPGPSGVPSRRARQVVATPPADESDSDSSDCIVVNVVKPEERTPVVISLLSSDEEVETTVRSPSPRQAVTLEEQTVTLEEQTVTLEEQAVTLEEQAVTLEEQAPRTAEEGINRIGPPMGPPREPPASPPRTRSPSFVGSGDWRSDPWTSDSDSRSSGSSADNRRASRKKRKEIRQSKLRSVVGSVVRRSSSSSSSRHRHDRKKSKKSKKHKHTERHPRRE